MEKVEKSRFRSVGTKSTLGRVVKNRPRPTDFDRPQTLVYLHTNFYQNRTIFWPCFGRESQTRGTPIPNFWYFFTLNKIWKWVEFEKNQWLQSWCWFYSVSWNLGCGATPIWAAWDQKYFSHLINSQKCLMGPSFDKIPEIELPPVLMTWKICLLIAHFFSQCYFFPISLVKYTLFPNCTVLQPISVNSMFFQTISRTFCEFNDFFLFFLCTGNFTNFPWSNFCTTVLHSFTKSSKMDFLFFCAQLILWIFRELSNFFYI